MNTIKRDVYVLRNTIKIPIEVTKGTDAISFEFTVRDYNLPATAAAVAYAYRMGMKKPNSTLCDVSGNVISFQPSANFFEVGMNELQIRVINEDKSLISFKEKVKCADSLGFPDEEEEKQKSLVEQLVAYTGKETAERKEADATEKAERKKEIAVERARIDQMTKLPDGSTTGDAELQDIRVGADGKTYETAGAAVREQVSSLKEDLGNVNSDMESLLGKLITPLYFNSFTDLLKTYTFVTNVIANHTYISLRDNVNCNGLFVNVIYDGQSAWGAQSSFSNYLWTTISPTNDGKAYFGNSTLNDIPYTGNLAIIDITDMDEETVNIIKEIGISIVNTRTGGRFDVVEKTVEDISYLSDTIKPQYYTEVENLYRSNIAIGEVKANHTYICLKDVGGGDMMYLNVRYKESSSWDMQNYVSDRFSGIFTPLENGTAYFGNGSSSTKEYSGRVALIDITDYDDNLRNYITAYTFDVIGKNIFSIDYMKKAFHGKTLLTYGDSITQQRTWQPYVCGGLGFTEFVNHGVGGRKLITMATDSSLSEITEDFDVLIVMGGMNDFIQDIQIGTITDDLSSNTFYGGLNALIDKLTTRYTDKIIVFMTPTPPFINDSNRFANKTGVGEINSNGNSIVDYANAMVNACKKWHIPCIDLNNLVGWNKNNISTFVSAEEYTTGSNVFDFIHPNSIGGKRIASWVVDELNGYLLN